MNPSKRIFVNTILQYARSIINTLLSLYTVRIVLNALGEDDYGVYTLVAGVVAMLGFVTNAMVITTQRHLSFYYGKKDVQKVRIYFSNSFLLHLCMAFFLVVVFVSLRGVLFSGYLEIAEERREIASWVYMMVIAMLVLTFISAPFKALFIAKENIWYITAVDVFDGILKFVLAITLLQLNVDKLLMYGVMMLIIMLVQFLAYSVYSVIRFAECQPTRIFKDVGKTYMLQLVNFAGWTTYGMGAVMVRTQGLSVLFNKMLCETAVNAAYGIGLQLYSAVSFISSSVQNAINPQIMQSEGQGDRKRMFNLAAQESKFVSCMMAILFIPLCFEMDRVLDAWLQDVPSYAPVFCRCFLLTFLADQLTYGLNAANQAIGKIRCYTLMMYTPKLLVIPVAWYMLKQGSSVFEVMTVYVVVELLVAIMRLPYMHYAGGLCVVDFCKKVFFRLLPLFICLTAVSCALSYTSSHWWRFFFTIPVSVLVGIVVAWKIVLSDSERQKITNIIKKKVK